MIDPEHHYAVRVQWQGNRGSGTSGYRDYGRDTLVSVEGKPALPASADRPFRGDPGRWNPEDMLVAALAQCHLLSYLHVATRNGIVVTAYQDDAVGTMRQIGDGGRFESVILRPRVTIASGDPELAQRLHQEASELCFIASSVSFPVHHEPSTIVDPAAD